MTNIGFIGLGIMGRPMADHLQKAGHQLFVMKHRAPVPPEIVAGGATVCASPRDIAEQAEVVIAMLPDTPDVERVLCGPNGMCDGLSAGKLIIDMSSISPTATRSLAERVNARGCDYLDAPVSGGEIGARNAALTIMVGGPESAFERARPLFDLLGKSVTLVGTNNGDGQTCKVANQIVVALTIEAVAEALVFASKAGADPARVRQALLGGFAGSRILELHGQRMIDRTFDPGFRVELHQKDLGLALETARQLGVSLPNTATTQELFNSCAALGFRGADHSALVHALETLSAHEIQPAPRSVLSG